jgi:putative membrane protein
MTELPSWAKSALGPDGFDRIEAAIAEAEAGTSGEIVPVLVRNSSTIGHVGTLAFAFTLITLLTLGIPGRLGELFGGPHEIWSIACWIIAGGVGLLLARFDAVQRILTSREDQIRQVDMRAEVEFYELGLSETEARTGVLLFVSLMEHRAVVLADSGIADKLDNEIWNQVVDDLVGGVKSGDFAAGMCAGIERSGALLAPHFPCDLDDNNELRDHLIVKD